MKSFEYSPFTDINVPYLKTPDLNANQRARVWWEVMLYTPLPVLSRWVVYRTFKNWF